MKNFKLVLKSLINNEACVTGGRKLPWYFAVIMLFVSMIICLVPTFVNTANKNGADFVNTYANGYDVATMRFAEDIQDKGADMSVHLEQGEKILRFSYAGKSGAEAWAMAYPEVNSFGHHCYKHLNAENNVDFEIYYIDGTLTQDYLNEIAQVKNIKEDGSVNIVRRTNNYFIFARNTLMGALYRANNGSVSGTLYGDYKHVEEGFGINSLALVYVNGQILTKETRTNPQFEGAYGAYTRGVWQNWKAFFNTTYLTNKYTAMWQTTLIMFGINLGIVVFMGLMVYLLTRGKMNPFRIYTIWDTQKIVYWAAPAPAVLSLAFGFMIASFAQIAFPLLIGMRLMWLSMKTLRPENAEVINKPSQPQNKNVQAKTISSKKK